MLISVVGVNEDSATLLIDAARFYIKTLMPRLADKIAVVIRVVDKFEFEGEAEWVDTNTKFPRVFVVTLKNGRLKKVISTLAHELVHVKQYARGELRHVAGATMWKKERHPVMKKSNNGKAYWLTPWEIEAYGMEVGLMEIYGDTLMADRERWPNERLR
jgi:hypothetical protein